MPERRREPLRRQVEELVARFEGEVGRRGWVTRRYPNGLRDDASRVDEVPSLYLKSSIGKSKGAPPGKWEIPLPEGEASLNKSQGD